MKLHEIKTTFVRIGQRVPGVLYEAENKAVRSHTAVLVMHSDEDYLTCPTGPELAGRGITTLCANVPVKEGLFFPLSDKLKAVREAMNYLRSVDCVSKIVLMGHSGGATLMTAYQAVAEKGVGVFQGENMIYPMEDIGELPPADGVMLFDPNWGNAAMQLFSLDPAVTDENSGKNINPAYDLFQPQNGFDPEGSTFSQEFIDLFQTQQGQRNNRILNSALERLRLIEQGKGNYDDDEPLVIPGANQVFFNNKLYAQDIRLMSHTREPHTLLHPDGTETVEIIKSLRGPENPTSLTANMMDGARIMTVRNYLSSYAVRTLADYGYDECGVRGIDWSSTFNCPPGNVRHISVPILLVGMTAGWEYLASETIYDMAASADKTVAFVEGAEHKFNPSHLEQFPGQFGDTMATLHNYAAGWINGRF